MYKRTRLNWIDSIKCFAIILVILGHLIQFIYYPITFDQNYIFRYIYSFHMPLFMAISGILSGINYNTTSLFKEIKKKAKQLLLPFLSWTLISVLIGKDTFINYIKYPDHGFWFLWCLFFIHIAYRITIIISKYLKIHFLAFLIIYSFIYLFSIRLNGLFGGFLIAKYYFYYMIGVYLSKSKYFTYFTNNILNKHYVILCIFIFFFLAFFWKRLEFSFTFFELNFYNDFFDVLYKTLTAFIGIISTIFLFQKIKIQNKIVKYIGQRTLAIYVIHFSL